MKCHKINRNKIYEERLSLLHDISSSAQADSTEGCD